GKVRGTTSVSAAYPAFLFGDQRLRGDDPTRLAYLLPAELVAASVRVPGVSDRVVPGRPRRAALATMDAKAATCRTPRAGGGTPHGKARSLLRSGRRSSRGSRCPPRLARCRAGT